MNKLITRVLVVDDEKAILELLRATLQPEGYETLGATSGTEALQIMVREQPDIMILDIMMPGIDGFEVLRRLRQYSDMPVIMLSARFDMADKVKCLNLGADDYITKPFGTLELLARVSAVLRRTKREASLVTLSSFNNGKVNIDFIKRRVMIAGNEVRFTPTEYDLLQELVLNAGKVLTYGYLLNKVWGPEYDREREYLHVFIGHLRAKIESDPANPRMIITTPGVGYRFEADGQNKV
jgi:two-component system KDP operon response regulator KdpE